MSFDKPLPPDVFGEEPNYIAVRLDIPTARAPLTGLAMHTIDRDYPGTWTYITTQELLMLINAPKQKPDVPAPKPLPATPPPDADTDPIKGVTAALLRLAKALEKSDVINGR